MPVATAPSPTKRPTGTAPAGWGNFDWVQHDDGSRTLLDVPVFFECKRDGEVYDAGYLRAAFDGFLAAAAINHFPPVNLGHRMLGRTEPEGVGHMAPSRLGKFNGRLAIFAHLTITNPRARDLIWSRRMPYRSAEVIKPSKGDPDLEELALLETAPFLKLPMTFPNPSPVGGADAPFAPPSVERASSDLAPVLAFASFEDRTLALMSNDAALDSPPKRRLRRLSDGTWIDLATGLPAIFAADGGNPFAKAKKGKKQKPGAEGDGDGDGDADPADGADDDDVDGEVDPAAAALGDEDGDADPADPDALGGDGGAKGAALKAIEALRQIKVPLEDAADVVLALEAFVNELKGGSEGNPDAPDPNKIRKPGEEPANPKPNPEPMNMAATQTTPAVDPSKATPAAPTVDAEVTARFAKLEGMQAAHEGQIAAFAAEKDQEKTLATTMKELDPFTFSSDPEARLRKVITDHGANWKVGLQNFAAGVKESAPKKRGPHAGAAAASGASDDYPEEVKALALKDPTEAEAALRCFAAFDHERKHGFDLPFATYYQANRSHFGATATR